MLFLIKIACLQENSAKYTARYRVTQEFERRQIFFLICFADETMAHYSSSTESAVWAIQKLETKVKKIKNINKTKNIWQIKY